MSKTPLNKIVITAFNRPRSLDRLLTSLKNARYGETKVDLIISIDKSDNRDVYRVAGEYEWSYGHKEVIKRSERLGLRNHVLECGSLTKQYKSIILLEEDLFVSPFFFEFAETALAYYSSDPVISGISLFSHNFNESIRFPFYPLEDGSDVFFLQIASSWGQLFWDDQWAEFHSWIRRNPDLSKIKGIPPKFLKWPESSWKKYYIAFLNETKKYFVYPRVSLTTNFSDEGGQHIKHQNAINQVPLLSGARKWKYIPFQKSNAKYDAYCELAPECMKRLNSKLKDYDFEVDLHGAKTLDEISTPYLITSKPTNRKIKNYGLSLKCIDLNIIYDNQGNFFSLSSKPHVRDSAIAEILRKATFFNFFYRETSLGLYVLLILKKLISHLKAAPVRLPRPILRPLKKRIGTR
jgi:hypothetical protein